jgi:hypothetical protein
MPFYPDTQTFYAVMDDLFTQVMAQPALLRPLRDGRIMLRMTLTEPAAVLVLDGRANPVRFATAAAAGPADIALRMPADALHAIWLGRERLRDAFSSGRIKLDSSPLRALSMVGSLTELFRYVESIYPGVLRARGML